MVMVSITAIIMLAYVCITLKPPLQAIPPFITFALAPIIHIPFSTGYHLFTPMSKKIKRQWLNLDISFIFVRISLVIFSLSYFVFDTVLLAFVTSGAIFFSAIVICKKAKCKKSLNKTKQALVVGGLVALLLAPIVYKACQHDPVSQMCIVGIVGSLAIGGSVYVQVRFSKKQWTVPITNKMACCEYK